MGVNRDATSRGPDDLRAGRMMGSDSCSDGAEIREALLPFWGPDFSCLSANADHGALFVRFTAGGEVWALSGRAGEPLSVSLVN